MRNIPHKRLKKISFLSNDRVIQLPLLEGISKILSKFKENLKTWKIIKIFNL